MTHEVIDGNKYMAVTATQWLNCVEHWLEKGGLNDAKRCLGRAAAKALTKRHWLRIVSNCLLLGEKDLLNKAYMSSKPLASGFDDYVVLARCEQHLGCQMSIQKAQELTECSNHWVRLADLNYEFKDTLQDMWCLQQAQRYADEYPFDWEYIAKAYINRKERQEALRCLDMAKQHSGQVSQWQEISLWRRLAERYHSLGESKEVISCLTTAVEKASKSSNFMSLFNWRRCAYSYHALLGDKDEAKRCMLEAVNIASKSTDAFSELKLCVDGYLKMGYTVEAKQLAVKRKSLVTIENPLLQASDLIYSAETLLGTDEGEAKKLLSKAMLLICDSGRYREFGVWVECSKVYFSLNDVAKAEECLNEALNSAEDSYSPFEDLCKLVSLRIDLGQIEIAKELLLLARKHIDFPPDAFNNWTTCAKYYFSLSAKQEAEDCLHEAEQYLDDEALKLEWTICSELYLEIGDLESFSRCDKEAKKTPVANK